MLLLLLLMMLCLVVFVVNGGIAVAPLRESAMWCGLPVVPHAPVVVVVVVAGPSFAATWIVVGVAVELALLPIVAVRDCSRGRAPLDVDSLYPIEVCTCVILVARYDTIVQNTNIYVNNNIVSTCFIKAIAGSYLTHL